MMENINRNGTPFPDTVRFGRADGNDTSALTELRLAYLREDLGLPAPEEEAVLRARLEAYFPAHLNRDLFAYVARNGKISACCFLLVTEKPPSPAFPHGKIGNVLNVYTRPDDRRRGLARQLMELLIRDAGAMGLDHLELKATEAGLRLYRSLGFAGEVSNYHSMKRRL